MQWMGRGNCEGYEGRPPVDARSFRSCSSAPARCILRPSRGSSPAEGQAQRLSRPLPDDCFKRMQIE
eukprot:3352309-Pyramimonas_sp.AAC.1